MSNSDNITWQLESAKALIGKNIRSRREYLKLSQEELGLRINADQAYVSRLERGLLNPTLESIVEIGHALNIEISELFTL